MALSVSPKSNRFILYQRSNLKGKRRPNWSVAQIWIKCTVNTGQTSRRLSMALNKFTSRKKILKTETTPILSTPIVKWCRWPRCQFLSKVLKVIQSRSSPQTSRMRLKKTISNHRSKTTWLSSVEARLHCKSRWTAAIIISHKILKASCTTNSDQTKNSLFRSAISSNSWWPRATSTQRLMPS